MVKRLESNLSEQTHQNRRNNVFENLSHDQSYSLLIGYDGFVLLHVIIASVLMTLLPDDVDVIYARETPFRETAFLEC